MTITEFVLSDEFKAAISRSTIAGYGGSSYILEIFKNGGHRVLWENEIGNLYEHPESLLIKIPQLTEGQVAEVDENNFETINDVIEFYLDDLTKELMDKFHEKITYSRICNLSANEREKFSKWLWGQTCPMLDYLPMSEQDGYYDWDYERWKKGLPVID